MIKQTIVPLQRMFWTGTLLENHTVIGEGNWYDFMGMYEADVLIIGMLDDEIVIEGSIMEKPSPEGIEEVTKPFLSNGKCRIGGYRKYRVSHRKASGNPVTVYLYGSN